MSLLRGCFGATPKRAPPPSFSYGPVSPKAAPPANASRRLISSAFSSARTGAEDSSITSAHGMRRDMTVLRGVRMIQPEETEADRLLRYDGSDRTASAAHPS